MSFPILATKLFIPPPRTELVARPRLLNRLDASFKRKPGLVLVSAPAGFGKTTLVSNWLHNLTANNQTDHVKSAWLSLDEGDNDLVRFLTYFIAALQQANPQLGQVIQEMLKAEPPQLPPLDSLLAALINDISAAATPLVLVLDDYHVIENQTIDEALNFIIEYQPADLFVVLASRIDPDLPLSRLRAKGRLTELRTADLRFTAEEAAEFLQKVTQTSLSAADIAALENKTEGWIAGLQLAALSMQSSSDITHFISAFTGSHRYIIDYLADEVLDRQPETTKQFLLQTSILNRLSAPLCNAVTRQDNSQNMLEQLEAANLFVIPLDNERRWYRYHHLFADLLRQRLRAVTANETVARLHGRAGQWHRRQAERTRQPEQVTEALHHTLRAGDVAEAARLVTKHIGSNLMGGRLTTVMNWLDQLPAQVVQTQPWLAIARAWVMYFSQQPDLVETFLQYAETQAQRQKDDLPPDTFDWIRGEIHMLRAWVAGSQGDLERAIELFHKSLALLPDNEESLRTRGLNYLFLASTLADKGDVAEAIVLVEQGITLCKAAGNDLAVMGGVYGLASLQAVQGRLQQAQATLTGALTWATEKKLLAMPSMGELYLGLGEILYEQNRLDEAENYLQAALDVSEHGLMITALPCATHLNLAQLELVRGHTDSARRHLQQAEEMLRTKEACKDNLELAARRIQLLLAFAQHDTGAPVGRWLQPAQDWLQKTDLLADERTAYNRVIKLCTTSRVLIAQAGHGLKIDTSMLKVALQMLNQLAQEAASTDKMGQLLETLVLKALVLAAQGNHAEAVAALKQALALAEPEGYIRLFVDEGPLLAALLQKALEQNVTPAYTQSLLAQFPAQFIPKKNATAPQLIEALSEREMEVLRLVAAGLSNKEIATELVLAVSTVKRHMSNVYSKLDVNNRTQAVTRARELHLL